jgi:hypothetical protein
MIKHGLYAMIFIAGWGASVVVMAEDVLESEGTRIIGDSDMPKALYIVPWKKPALPTLSARSITPFVNDALSLIDRESLLFRLKQHEIFHRDRSGKAGQ